jgi:hypothetical protein
MKLQAESRAYRSDSGSVICGSALATICNVWRTVARNSVQWKYHWLNGLLFQVQDLDVLGLCVWVSVGWISAANMTLMYLQLLVSARSEAYDEEPNHFFHTFAFGYFE